MTRFSSALRRTVVRPEPAGGFAIATLVGGGLGVAGLLVAMAVFGWSPSPLTWYLARASGLVLYLLLWLALVTGLGLTTTLLDRCGGRAVVFSLHRFATGLSYGFLALHLLSLAADPTVAFGPRELLVPFVAPWREPWTGFGVLAGQLTLVIGASGAVRRLTGYRVWRALHWLTLPLFALTLLHGLGAGNDTSSGWAQMLYLVTTAAVVCLALYRLLRVRRRVPTEIVSSPPLDRLSAGQRPSVRPHPSPSYARAGD